MTAGGRGGGDIVRESAGRQFREKPASCSGTTKTDLRARGAHVRSPDQGGGGAYGLKRIELHHVLLGALPDVQPVGLWIVV